MTGVHVAPLVSVVMAVYNGEEHVGEAIRSILSQTLADFELIVVDDGSQDRSREIVMACTDSRVRLICNPQNRGLAASLNRGVVEACGEFIARMDHDDISLPQRLARQVDFLRKNPQLGACGTWVETLGDFRQEIWRAPTTPEAVRMQLLFDSALLHPTVMFRRDLFLQHSLRYDESFTCAQDYELWERASHVVEMGNIAQVLVRYRVHPAQTGQIRRQCQREFSDTVRVRALQVLGLVPDKLEIALHTAIARGEVAPSLEFLRKTADWLDKIMGANQQSAYFDSVAFGEFLGKKWWGTCFAVSSLGFPAYQVFRGHALHKLANLSSRQKMNFLRRCWFAGSKRTPMSGAGYVDR